MDLNPNNYKKDDVHHQSINESSLKNSLHDKFQDESVDRGIPQDLSQRKGANVKSVGFLILGLGAILFIIAGVWFFLEKDQQVAVENQSKEQVVAVTMKKDFEEEKNNLLPLPEEAEEEKDRVNSTSFETTTATPNEPSEPVYTPFDRKKEGEVLISGDSASYQAKVDANTVNNANLILEEPNVSLNEENNLNNHLKSTVFAEVSANRRDDLTLLMNRGTIIPCVLITRIDTTYPSITKCQLTKDIYSADGKILLLERGSVVVGEQQTAIIEGSPRIFVLWSQIETPSGVVVNINSPSTDQLGASGQPAQVNYHFFKKFGGAILISVIDHVVNGITESLASKKTINLKNIGNGQSDMATEALKNKINIPPTGYVKQGALLNIIVAHDVDFRSVYEVISREEDI